MTTVAAEVIGHRYARRVASDKAGHLLTRTWPDPGSRGRPALCGARAQKWRALHLFDDPAAFHDCTDCSVAAGIAPPAPPVRIAPARPAPRVDLAAATPVAAAENTQAARTLRRAGFLARPVPTN